MILWQENKLINSEMKDHLGLFKLHMRIVLLWIELRTEMIFEQFNQRREVHRFIKDCEFQLFWLNNASEILKRFPIISNTHLKIDFIKFSHYIRYIMLWEETWRFLFENCLLILLNAGIDSSCVLRWWTKEALALRTKKTRSRLRLS
jgi:hypothetical protein